METPQRKRVSRFVETFDIMRLLWSGDEVTYTGKHYNINQGVSINPKPVAQPLPMWIAAEAEPAIAVGPYLIEIEDDAPGGQKWRREGIRLTGPTTGSTKTLNASRKAA